LPSRVGVGKKLMKDNKKERAGEIQLLDGKVTKTTNAMHARTGVKKLPPDSDSIWKPEETDGRKDSAKTSNRRFSG